MKKITIHFTVNHEPVTVEVEPNQRLIDVPATRRAGSVVEWQPASFSLEKPSNW